MGGASLKNLLNLPRSLAGMRPFTRMLEKDPETIVPARVGQPFNFDMCDLGPSGALPAKSDHGFDGLPRALQLTLHSAIFQVPDPALETE